MTILCLRCGAQGNEPILHFKGCSPIQNVQTSVWKMTDPRLDINKRDTIALTDGNRTVVGHVETHHAWSIELSDTIGGRTHIGEKDDWPTNWAWTRVPRLAPPAPLGVSMSVESAPNVAPSTKTPPYRLVLRDGQFQYYSPTFPQSSMRIDSEFPADEVQLLFPFIRQACRELEIRRMSVARIAITLTTSDDIHITAYPPSEYKDSVQSSGVIIARRLLEQLIEDSKKEIDGRAAAIVAVDELRRYPDSLDEPVSIVPNFLREG